MNLHQKTVLITEVTECIGQRAAVMALEQGMNVRGLVRSPAAAQQVAALGINGIELFISDTPAAIAQACQDVDVVINTPPLLDENDTLENLRQMSVEPAVAIAVAAQAAGVRCFIQISSVLVYGFRYPEQATETAPLCTDEDYPICVTQREAEQKIMQLNNPPFGVISLRVGDVYGAESLLWVSRPLEMMKAGGFFIINQGKGIMNHLYIDNLVDAIFLAAEKEVYGEVFNITDGDRTTCKDYYNRLAQIGNLPAPTSVPLFVAKTAAKMQNGKGGISLVAIDAVTRPHTYSIEKATRVLGYQPRVRLDEGMEKTRAWLNR